MAICGKNVLDTRNSKEDRFREHLVYLKNNKEVSIAEGEIEGNDFREATGDPKIGQVTQAKGRTLVSSLSNMESQNRVLSDA